ncbi:hypothetical protein F5879DRAFT_925729 [Lentinula edodes]|nr:hypothetical protein F5879DRAFT_925729 [Lentinula edodes]
MTAPHASTSADALGVPPSSPNRRDSDVDEILSLFKSVFGVGVSLACYIIDDPLWSTLAAAAFARHFLEVHGDPGQRTCYSLPTEQWRILYDRVEQSTNSTSALLELNPLDDQDQRELDRQELREFRQRQLLVPVPSTSVPHTSPLAGGSSLLPPAPVTKKRKQPAKVDPGSTPKHRRPKQAVDRPSPIAPPVPQVEGGSGYRGVVLVLRPPHVPDSEIPTLPGVGHLVPEDSSYRSVVEQSRSQGYAEIPHRVPQAGSFEQLVLPSEVEDFSRGRIKTPPVQQHSREPMRPYPRSQASSALRVENDRLKTEVEELRTLLAQSRGQVSTLTSLLRDTSSLLDLRSQELEASRRSLEEFQAIEAELPEPASKDLVTRFRIAHSEVDAYKEVAKRQKQEIGELHRLEELEEMVCSYRDRAHVAEGLIRQYPEDEGLYEVELPSLSEVQRKLDASDALHAGYVDAHPGSLEPPLHRRFFSFDHPIPITPSPTSDHLPAVPAMDSIMVSWERLIANYIRDMIDTPGPRYFFPTSADLTVVGGGPSPLEGSVLAEEDDENAPREVVGVTGEAGVALCPNVTTPAEEDDRDPPVGGSETPAMAQTPLFLLASRSPLSPLLLPSVPVVPHIIDLTMINDDGEDLYESREEFEARMQGDVAVKNERSSPAL